MVTPEEMAKLQRAVEQFEVVREQGASLLGGVLEEMTGELAVLLPAAIDQIALSPRVNQLIGEIMTMFALAENGIHSLLPADLKYHRSCKEPPPAQGPIVSGYRLISKEPLRGKFYRPAAHSPSMRKDIDFLRQLTCDGRFKGDIRRDLQRITCLALQVLPDRNNIAHGHIILFNAFVMTLPAFNVRRADSGSPPSMTRAHERKERNITELSEEILNPIASKCRELVSLIARLSRAYAGSDLP